MVRRRVRSVVRLLALLLLVGGVARATGWREPPRFDGAGYATLARALADGRGYREVDRPDAPPHAHFPPAYPAVLSFIWLGVGTADRADFTRVAHGLSLILTAGGFLAFAAWWRRVESPGVAVPLTLALALNWQWHRGGGAIRSEPLALALTGLTLVLAQRAGSPRRGGIASLIALALVLAGAILTRQVLICLTGAILVNLTLRRGWRVGLPVGLGVMALISPWLVWQRAVGSGSQAGLFDGSDLPRLVAGQALFYARRLPDAVAAPVVEVATVFTRWGWLGPVATLGAVLVTGVALVGWVGIAQSPRRRVGALVPLLTLPLLLIWPFTEAGRFLVPLIPFILMGLTEGGGAILERLGVRRARGRAVAAWVLVAGAVPYSAYALIADRAGSERRLQWGFDGACRRLARPDLGPGVVMARHPADAAWLSGRLAVPIPDGGPARIAAEIERWGVAYLVVDDNRYARSGANPLRALVADPTQFRLVYFNASTEDAAYQIIRVSSPAP